MQILLEAKHESVPAEFPAKVDEIVRHALAHHAERLTRVTVYLSDQNAHKGGIDKRCVVEARPSGMDPLSGEFEGRDLVEALKGALERLDRVLGNRFGKLASREREG